MILPPCYDINEMVVLSTEEEGPISLDSFVDVARALAIPNSSVYLDTLVT